jgi:hypothetical protein
MAFLLSPSAGTVRAAEQAGLTVERTELFPDRKLSFYTARRPAEQGQENNADEIIAKLK